jgi:hypothetical protein
MSGYFQRLIDQSGLAIPPPPARAIPAGTAAAPGMTDYSVGPDVVEIHEEHLTESGPSAASFPLEKPSRASPPAQPARPPSPPPREGPVRDQEANTVFQETVSFSSGTGTAQPLPPRESPGETQPKSGAASAQGASQPEIPPEVLQAVMNWISAGPEPGHREATPAMPSPPTEARNAGSSESPPPVIAAPVLSSEKIADRVIEITEELVPFESLTPAASPSASPPPRIEDPRRASPSSEDPVCVSIGSIQVRIEAPVSPAPAPPARKRPVTPTRAAAPAARAAGFSKLRRHYIIPH